MLTILFILIQLTSPAEAHDTHQNTVRIQLRDKHFQILIRVQMLDWLAVLGSSDVNPTKEFSIENIPKQLLLGQEALLNDVQLLVNDQPAKIRVLSYPTASEIANQLKVFDLLSSKSVVLPHNFGWEQIQLEGIIQSSTIEHVRLQMPSTFGDLSIHFEEHISQDILSGGAAVFTLKKSTTNRWVLNLLMGFVALLIGYTIKQVASRRLK